MTTMKDIFLTMNDTQNLNGSENIETEDEVMEQDTLHNKQITRNIIEQEHPLKRKCPEDHKMPKKFSNPRYIGDLRIEDCTSKAAWEVLQAHVHTTRKKQKALHDKIIHLRKKFQSLQSLSDHLKSNGLLTNEESDALEVNKVSDIIFAKLVLFGRKLEDQLGGTAVPLFCDIFLHK